MSILNKLKLKIKWDKKEQEYTVFYPAKCDGGLFLQLLEPQKILTYSQREYYDNDNRFERLDRYTFNDPNFLNGVTWFTYSHNIIKDLEERGYDPKTLKIEISIKPEILKSDFPHLYEQLTDLDKNKLGIE